MGAHLGSVGDTGSDGYYSMNGVEICVEGKTNRVPYCRDNRPVAKYFNCQCDDDKTFDKQCKSEKHPVRNRLVSPIIQCYDYSVKAESQFSVLCCFDRWYFLMRSVSTYDLAVIEVDINAVSPSLAQTLMIFLMLAEQNKVPEGLPLSEKEGKIPIKPNYTIFWPGILQRIIGFFYSFLLKLIIRVFIPQVCCRMKYIKTIIA
jgi:hypothetical protein